MWLLGWPGQAFHPCDGIVLPAEIHALPGKQLLDHGKSLFETLDSFSSSIKCEPQLLVVEWSDPCPESQFKASVRQDIQGRYFFGEQRRVPVIITKHVTANAQRRGGFRGYGQRHKWSQARDGTIRH